MVNEKQITQVLSEINRATIENEIEWYNEAFNPDVDLDSYQIFSGVTYSTTFKDRRFILFKIKQQIVPESYNDDPFEIFVFRLIIKGKGGTVDWEFPEHRGIKDIYESANYKSAEIKDFFDTIAPEEAED